MLIKGDSWKQFIKTFTILGFTSPPRTPCGWVPMAPSEISQPITVGEGCDHYQQICSDAIFILVGSY